MSEENRADVTELPPTPCSVLEAVRGMVRDRQYAITIAMDAAPARDFPIENAAWQRVKHELEAVADLCNRMIYRISSEERQRASCPEDGNYGDALAIPRSSGDSSPNAERMRAEPMK